jgi:hypothetical protein
LNRENLKKEIVDIEIQKQLRGLVLWECVFVGVTSYRDTVERTHGIRFEIRPKEMGHNVPHCHACFEGQNISISLTDFTILAGNIPLQKSKFAVGWVETNIKTLQAHWDKYHVMEV